MCERVSDARWGVFVDKEEESRGIFQQVDARSPCSFSSCNPDLCLVLLVLMDGTNRVRKFDFYAAVMYT